jgi:hypothetical protein
MTPDPAVMIDRAGGGLVVRDEEPTDHHPRRGFLPRTRSLLPTRNPHSVKWSGQWGLDPISGEAGNQLALGATQP